MDIPKGATVGIADGERLTLYRNDGDEANPKLVATPNEDVSNDNKGSGGRHRSSSANPDDSQQVDQRRLCRGDCGFAQQEGP